MKINRNIFWTENFFNRLSLLGVKNVCISPGSRSTALTFSAALNKKFRCFVHIDERSSGYFALGLAKASHKPVIIITTSGTATAELYPAVIEAYQQRIPLIVCTADRPPELIGRGANQTINQDNLYKNHIIFYQNAGLPQVSVTGIKKIINLADKAYVNSESGPVHINFPFRKPFEPGTYTDDIDKDNLALINSLNNSKTIFPPVKRGYDKNILKEILDSLENSKKGLILAGPLDCNEKEKSDLLKLSKQLNFPVLADASSQLRFGKHSNENVLVNYEGFLRAERFAKNFVPGLILQFGRTPSSKALETYLTGINPKRYIINKYGDIFDPWNSASGIFKCGISLFCKLISEGVKNNKKSVDVGWRDDFLKADNLIQRAKEEVLKNSIFPNEGRIIPEIMDTIPENTHLFISNSMPVRDFDYFCPVSKKDFYIHTNRGASGIDGIISTSLGIQKAVQKPTILITGDLAFYYDLNSLLTAYKYKIPLVIVLLNNNGGGIFSMLPVSGYGKIFNEYFVSPQNLNFALIVKSFKGNYKLVNSGTDLRKSIKKALNEKIFTVLEIRTEIKTSVQIRKNYFKESEKIINQNFYED